MTSQTTDDASSLGQALVTRDGGIARLTLNNPRRKNAITLEMAAFIEDFCSQVEADETIGAVLLAGAGGYFCSGADTRVLAASSADPASPEAVASISAVYRAFTRIGSLPVPTVSLVEGGAVGAGMNLALATDVLLVTADAVLDSGFLARGIHPGGGHLTLLGRRLGYQQTAAHALLGRAMSGTEAVTRGLAYAAYDAAELLPAATELVALAAKDPELTRRVKQSLTLELGGSPVTWPTAVEIERGAQMWSLARKGREGWDRKPAKPAP
jgi:enoyl-CoA hydratase